MPPTGGALTAERRRTHLRKPIRLDGAAASPCAAPALTALPSIYSLGIEVARHDTA
jgi:hypothetical protein